MNLDELERIGRESKSLSVLNSDNTTAELGEEWQALINKCRELKEVNNVLKKALSLTVDREELLEEAVKEAAYMIEGIADVHDPNCLWQDDGPCDCHKERAENWSSKYGKGE